MLKTSAHVLMRFEKAYDQIPQEKLWGLLWEYSIEGHLLLAVKSSIPAQKFLSVSAELNLNCSQWVLDSGKGVCCQHSL